MSGIRPGMYRCCCWVDALIAAACSCVCIQAWQSVNPTPHHCQTPPLLPLFSTSPVHPPATHPPTHTSSSAHPPLLPPTMWWPQVCPDLGTQLSSLLGGYLLHTCAAATGPGGCWQGGCWLHCMGPVLLVVLPMLLLSNPPYLYFSCGVPSPHTVWKVLPWNLPPCHSPTETPHRCPCWWPQVRMQRPWSALPTPTLWRSTKPWCWKTRLWRATPTTVGTQHWMQQHKPCGEGGMGGRCGTNTRKRLLQLHCSAVLWS